MELYKLTQKLLKSAIYFPILIYYHLPLKERSFINEN